MDINGCYICTCNTHTHTLQAEAGEDDALDARGIPGWDKVHHLAKVLIDLSITNSQARNIKELYDALLDYDKKNDHLHRKANETGKRKVCSEETLQSWGCWYRAGEEVLLISRNAILLSVQELTGGGYLHPPV